MQLILDIISVISAAGAAIFWFYSAWGKVPPMKAYYDQIPESDPFYKAIKFSIKMNKIAALLSGISVACQGAKICIQLWW